MTKSSFIFYYEADGGWYDENENYYNKNGSLEELYDQDVALYEDGDE